MVDLQRQRHSEHAERHACPTYDPVSGSRVCGRPLLYLCGRFRCFGTICELRAITARVPCGYTTLVRCPYGMRPTFSRFEQEYEPMRTRKRVQITD